MPSTVQPSPVETQTINLHSLGPRGVITVGASPCSIQNSMNTRVMVLVSIGTVTLIEFSRDGVTFDAVGLIAGQFHLNPGDWLKITHVVAPTVVFYPM